MNKVDTLIFDLDGTLLDTIEDVKHSVNHVLKIHGYQTYETSDYLKFIGRGSKYLISQAINDADPALIDKIYDEYLLYYLDNSVTNTSAYRYIKQGLKKACICGYKIFVFTNKPEDLAKKIVSIIFSDIKFTGIISSCKRFKPKPDNEGLTHLLNENGLNPENVMYFGDSDYDMIVSKSCNIPYRIGCAYGYQDEKRLNESGATHICHSSKEAIDLIFKYGNNKGIVFMIITILVNITLALTSFFLAYTSSGSYAFKIVLYIFFSFCIFYTIVDSSLFFTNTFCQSILTYFASISFMVAFLLSSYLFIPTSSHSFNITDKIDLVIMIIAILFFIVAIYSLVIMIKNKIKIYHLKHVRPRKKINNGI